MTGAITLTEVLTMPRFAHFRVAALGLLLSCGAVTLPALASQPVNVTFQPNSHWAQEVDSVSHLESSHEYTVTIATGQILQINLISRNPNLFFKVKDTTTDKQLVDTFKTGATTWSTQPSTAPASYLVMVYIDPAAIQEGNQAKYALQVGQYGLKDIRAPATDVTFAAGNPWAQMVGSLDANATAHDYNVAMQAGNTLRVNLIAQNPKLHFTVTTAASSQPLVDTASTGTASWSTPVDTAATYTVHVAINPADISPGQKAGFALQIGQYPTNAPASAPAAAATTTTPAAASVPASSAGH